MLSCLDQVDGENPTLRPSRFFTTINAVPLRTTDMAEIKPPSSSVRHSTLWPKKARFRSGRGSTGAVKVHVFFFSLRSGSR